MPPSRIVHKAPPSKVGSPDQMISAVDLAARWAVSRYTLQRMRNAGNGPTAYKFGGAVRYRLADIAAHEQASRVTAGGAS